MRKEMLPEEKVRLRWLEGEGCLEARPLWEAVFSEDSAAFTAYYFAWKAAKNRGLILEGADGLRAMLYLTPERMRVREREIGSAYIVGVATKPQYRHRGYMTCLLREALTALRGEGMPFAFLMPASPDLYTPFGFAWIYDRPVWDAASLRRDRLTELGEADAERLARFASAFLEREKAVYVCRDAAYYRMQGRELAAQNGCILGYAPGDRLQGICMYTQEERPEIPEVLAGAEAEAAFVSRGPEERPAIMARVLCAEAMLSLVRFRQEQEFLLDLTDPLIAENDALFFCRAGADGCSARRYERGAFRDGGPSGVPRISLTVGELTALLFGYRGAAHPAFPGLEPLSPVWINEIV